MYVRNDINIFFSSTGVMTLSFSKHSNLTLFTFVMISLISFICWISLLFSSSNANEFFTFHSKAIVMKENERNKGVKAILILKLFHMNACKIISFILRVSTCTHMYFKRVIFACTISCRNWFFIKLSLIWLSAFLNVPIFWYNYINYLTFGVVLDFSRHRFPPKTLNSKTAKRNTFTIIHMICINDLIIILIRVSHLQYSYHPYQKDAFSDAVLCKFYP